MTNTDRTGSPDGLLSLNTAHSLKSFKRNDCIFFEIANAPATRRVPEANCQAPRAGKSI